eukprot:255180-Chlamydomonas_euryale.AAC.1
MPACTSHTACPHAHHTPHAAARQAAAAPDSRTGSTASATTAVSSTPTAGSCRPRPRGRRELVVSARQQPAGSAAGSAEPSSSAAPRPSILKLLEISPQHFRLAPSPEPLLHSPLRLPPSPPPLPPPPPPLLGSTLPMYDVSTRRWGASLRDPRGSHVQPLEPRLKAHSAWLEPGSGG